MILNGEFIMFNGKFMICNRKFMILMKIAMASADRRRQLHRRCYAQVARHAAGCHNQGLQRAANRMRSGLPAAKQARGLQRRGGGGASLFTVAGQARACIEKLMILHRSCTVPSDHDLQ